MDEGAEAFGPMRRSVERFRIICRRAGTPSTTALGNSSRRDFGKQTVAHGAARFGRQKSRFRGAGRTLIFTMLGSPHRPRVRIQTQRIRHIVRNNAPERRSASAFEPLVGVPTTANVPRRAGADRLALPESSTASVGIACSPTTLVGAFSTGERTTSIRRQRLPQAIPGR
jgi:hypothetical protein